MLDYLRRRQPGTNDRRSDIAYVRALRSRTRLTGAFWLAVERFWRALGA